MGSIVSAPGKLMLLGEYAVLEGGLALAMAVNRRAVGRRASDGAAAGLSPVVAAVFEAARRAGFPPPLNIEIDTSAFRDDAGLKLGLGSSAAAAVIAASLATDRRDETALQVAIEGHRAAFGVRR
jgi:phosphomevalonate kinase